MFYQRRKSSFEVSLTQLLQFPTKWKKFKNKFKKKYDSEEEESQRKRIFFERYRFVEEHNKKYKANLVPFKVMVTEYSDLSDDEILQLRMQNVYRYSITQFSTDNEEWESFKIRKKKKFKSLSAEDIPKLFFLARLNEIKEFRNELDEMGLRADLKEMDNFCDFGGVPEIKTMLDEKEDYMSTLVDKAKRLKEETKEKAKNYENNNY